MTDKRNLKELFDTLEYSNVNELLIEIYDKAKVSIAIFDLDGILQCMSMDAKHCKCYYMLLHNKENKCSIFDYNFSKPILAQKEVDTLCNYSCRLTMREININGKLYKIIVFQYNLDNDNLGFNSTNNPDYAPLYRGIDTTAIDYFWSPNIINKEEIDFIFDFLKEELGKLKEFY